MFREMRRFKQALSKEEIVEVLQKEKRGVLSVLGDDGYPYGVPINFYYDEETNKIFFHGAKVGHRSESMLKNPKVSFCVFGQDYQEDDDWSKYVKSVVVFGKAVPIEDIEVVAEWSRKLCSKFPCPDGYADYEISKDAVKTLCFFIEIEDVKGKLVHEK